MYEEMLPRYLKRLGLSPSIKGYCAVQLAIIAVLENPSLLNHITSRLYPLIANEIKATPVSVEKTIRYAIEHAWLNADLEFVEDVFENAVDINRGKPTNKQFIFALAEYLRIDIIFNVYK